MTTDTTQRVRCAGCGFEGLLSKVLELSHGSAVCPECDSRQIRNVDTGAQPCACGQELKNTANTERS